MSKNRKALKAVLKQVEANAKRAGYLSVWRHLKTDTLYVVRSHYIDEKTLSPYVLYYAKGSQPWETWGRSAEEFFDGRFEQTFEGYGT